MALRIIQVFNRYLQPGGEEVSVARIAQDLEDGGKEVERFWRDSREWQKTGAPARWRQGALLWKNSAVLGELARLQRERRADLWLLHNVVPVVSLGIYRLALELRVPVIQWLHNYRPLSPSGSLHAGKRMLRMDDPLLAWREIMAGSWNGRVRTAAIAMGYAWVRMRGHFRSVRAWVAVSEQMRRLFEQANWSADRLYALRHSWRISHPMPREPVDQGHFLFLGRMAETKGVRFLMEAWKDPRMRDVPLVMAGDGELRRKLEEVSPPSVRWVGHVQGEEKLEWLRSCRAVLFPSVWPEPLSTVAYEAYEAGKPVLASDQGGMKEIVWDGSTGRILPVSSPEPWRRAVLEMRRQPDLARTYGVNGRRWLEANEGPEPWNKGFDAIVGKAIPELRARP